MGLKPRMKSSIVAKLEALQERHEEVLAYLGDASVIADQDRFRALSREYAQLTDVTRCFKEWRSAQDDIEAAEMMLDDLEMREMAQEELKLPKRGAKSSSSSYKCCCCQKILMMNVTASWKSARGLAAMKPLFCR